MTRSTGSGVHPDLEAERAAWLERDRAERDEIVLVTRYVNQQATDEERAAVERRMARDRDFREWVQLTAQKGPSLELPADRPTSLEEIEKSMDESTLRSWLSMKESILSEGRTGRRVKLRSEQRLERQRRQLRRAAGAGVLLVAAVLSVLIVTVVDGPRGLFGDYEVPEVPGLVAFNRADTAQTVLLAQGVAVTLLPNSAMYYEKVEGANGREEMRVAKLEGEGRYDVRRNEPYVLQWVPFRVETTNATFAARTLPDGQGTELRVVRGTVTVGPRQIAGRPARPSMTLTAGDVIRGDDIDIYRVTDSPGSSVEPK